MNNETTTETDNPREVFEAALGALSALAGEAGRMNDFLIVLASRLTNQRYAILSDGTILRNRNRKPLLHNGKAPRK